MRIHFKGLCEKRQNSIFTSHTFIENGEAVESGIAMGVNQDGLLIEILRPGRILEVTVETPEVEIGRRLFSFSRIVV